MFSYTSKLVVIFSSIFAKLLPFLALQAAVLYIFTTAFSLGFNDIPIYQEEGPTFQLLFSAYFGSFDFAALTDDTLSKLAFGFFLIVNFLVMVNLLIAVLLEDYSSLSRSARPLYLRWLLRIEPLWAYHPSLAPLSFKTGPFVLLSLPFAPCLLLCRRSFSRRLSRFLQVLQFLPPLLFMALLYLLSDILYFFLALRTLLSPSPSIPFRYTPSLKKGHSSRRCRLLGRAICCCPCILLQDLLLFLKEAFTPPRHYLIT